MILKLLTNPSVSIACGKFLDSRISCLLIKPFVKKNHIQLSDFYSDHFSCFNDCFCRKIKEEKRPIDCANESLISPCDGLLSVYQISENTVLPVKQSQYSISDLVEDERLAVDFEGGLCLVFRLCVNHYHRYCYFDDGTKGDNHFIKGVLHTVQPVALRKEPVFVRNSREYTVLSTENFGKAVQVEVGAMLVGKIRNNHGASAFKRGEEKGCFLYGGSTIILLLQKGAAKLENPFDGVMNRGVEIPVEMGQRIGSKI